MHVNAHHRLASSLILCIVATACGFGLSPGDNVPGPGSEGGKPGNAAQGKADTGTGGSSDDAAGEGQDGPAQADGSIADGTASSDGSEGDSANTGTDAGPQGPELVVWNGESANPACSSWANPATCSTAIQSAESHSPPNAVEFKFNDTSGNWPGGGWDWANGQVGPYGTDITSKRNFTFWLKTKGQVVQLSFNLLCNGAPALDEPQHHTNKVVVSTYNPRWNDGNWHQIIVPIADLTQPAGFDAQHVSEFQFFNTGPGNGSFFFDDIGFE